MRGWIKPKCGAMYAGVSERTFRPWLKRGLRHVRLPSGTILIKYEWVDKFLENFEVQDNEVSRIVDEVEKEMGI
jgi:hypothetical protein